MSVTHVHVWRIDRRGIFDYCTGCRATRFSLALANLYRYN